MRRVAVGIALAAAMMGVGAAQTSSRIIANPQWLWQPDAEDLTALYTGSQLKPGPKVVATLECTATAEGHLAPCRVLDLTPKGADYTELAQEAASLFRMRATDLDGAPVARRQVRLSLEITPPTEFDTPPVRVGGPTVSALAAVWPATARGRPGATLLKCVVTIQGALRDCKAVQDDPPGEGFGDAGLLIAPNLTYKPALKDGRPVDAPVMFRVKWTGEGPSGSPTLSITSNFLWARAPGVADVKAAYPQDALRQNVEGHVVLRCGLTADALLKSCDVLTELPRGYGFGRAAKSLVPLFKGEPLGDALKALATLRVDVPFGFSRSGQPDLAKARWTRKFDPDAVLQAFPEEAAKAGLAGGRASLDCAAAKDGSLDDCRVVGEDPPGMGFGPAGVALAKSMAINPWTDDGQPAEGARFRFAIRFVHKEPGPEPASPNKP